ncbi:MAG: hypothetical protein WBF79_11360 [Rhodococcus sp. (in: high G+C Gram-positive bacteria)]
MSEAWSSADKDLLVALNTMWEDHDPPPDGLADDLIVALAGHGLAEEWDLLQCVGDELAGVRSASEVSTFEFELGPVSLVVRVAPESSTSARLDGWLTSQNPVAQNRVVLITDAEERTGVVDADGRFEFARVGGHRWRLRFFTVDGNERLQTPEMPR